MAKKRKSSGRRRRQVQAYHIVRFMDVEKHTSKRSGREMLRVSFQLSESVKEWPVDVYFDPDSPSDFMRNRWHDFCTEQEQHGGRVRGIGKSLEMIVELSDDWVQPETIGVCVETEKDETGQIRENWEVLEFDWSGEHLSDVLSDEVAAVKQEEASEEGDEVAAVKQEEASEADAEEEQKRKTGQPSSPDYDDELPF